VESGRELLLALAEKPRTFSLILTDVAMPDVNGLEVLRYVRSQPALHSLPVIMMSAHENAGTGAPAWGGSDIPTRSRPTRRLTRARRPPARRPPVFECIQRGAEDYLLKPLTQKEVKQIWQHVWRRRYSWQRVSEQKKAEAEAAAAAGGPYPPQEPTAQPAPLPLPDYPPPPPAKALSSERETADEAVELYTTAEMRQHCMRQIARYQRVLQVIGACALVSCRPRRSLARSQTRTRTCFPTRSRR